MLTRARQIWAFGSHVPSSKLARRAVLQARRQLADWTGLVRRPSPDVRRSSLPMPGAFIPANGAMFAEGDVLKFTFLGVEHRCPRGQIDWAPAARDQLWRMNLHYMEYLRDADDDLFENLVSSWISTNGQPTPGAWREGWNSYALSIRVVEWMQQLGIRSHRLPRAFVASAEASLARQLSFLERNLETDIGGNHLIKNIKALIWGGRYFDGPAARRWARVGRRLLLNQVSAQILADGVHYERSLSYHCQVFADLIECRIVADDLSDPLDRVLALMAQPTADLIHPDGKVIQFNDAGLTMTRSPDECLSAYAAIGGIRPAQKLFFRYADSGYFGRRTPVYFLVIDCGAICPDDLPAHGHGDVLSIELSASGRRLFVDQGVFEYVAGPKREASRRAASHNTLSVDGADQAEFFGAFRCGRRPRAHVDYCEIAAGCLRFSGWHDGYSGLPGRPIHRRRIDARERLIEIHDHLETGLDRAARVSFLLHSDVAVANCGDSLLLTLADGIYVRMTSSVRLKVEPAVWWPDMGTELETKRIVAETEFARAGIRTSLDFQIGHGPN